MYSSTDTKPAKVTSYSIFWPVLAAIVLLISIMPLPRPSMLSLLPWKSELGITIALTAIVAGHLLSKGQDDFLFPKPQAARAISLILGLFCIWSSASIAWASSPSAVLHHSSVWVLYLITFSVAPYLLDAEERPAFILRSFSIICFVLAALSIFDYATTENFSYVDGAIRIRYGRFAELLVTLVPVLIASSILSDKLKARIAYGAAAACGWIAAMLSLSKGAFLAGIIGSAICFAGISLFSSKKYRRSLVTAAAIMILLTGAMQFLFSAIIAAPSTTDYLTGSADPSRSTSVMRLFTWKVTSQMIRENWGIGVGADNFGLAFNQARRSAAASNDTATEIADDYIVERAHNEPLQIFAELGIVGILILLAAIAVFAIAVFGKIREIGRELSPMFWGAVGGMTAFGISSMVSSFSFRAAQNGIVFFLVLVVAITSITDWTTVVPKKEMSKRFRGSDVVIVGTLLLLVGFFSIRGVAEFLVYRAEREPEISKAENYFETAKLLDPNYATADILFAGREFGEGNVEKAALVMRRAIDGGVGVTTTYGDLAKFWFEAGDNSKSEAAIREALEIYPGSVYLRVRYAIFLQKTGRAAESQTQLEKARSLDKRQANGWYALIANGSTNAYFLSQVDTGVAPPAELTPANAVFQYVDKVPGR